MPCLGVWFVNAWLRLFFLFFWFPTLHNLITPFDYSSNKYINYPVASNGLKELQALNNPEAQLARLFSSEETRKAFKIFCKAKDIEHEVNFYLAIQRYKLLPNHTHKKVSPAQPLTERQGMYSFR